jgi:LmbE family N-acetylglucosaminyl deacetylase
MGTLLCFHAHPDDESLATGGTIARAAAEGHRVILVVATGGEHGQVPDDLAEGESLADRRARELRRSAELLGVHRLEFLGYQDSGMTGWEQNQAPGAFMNATVDDAATRLAEILRSEQVDTLTVYDWHGNYGHPDHVQVHRVGRRAAELAGTAHVYDATINRDQLFRLVSMAKQMGIDAMGDFNPEDTDDGIPLGMPEAELTTAVDVSAYVAAKRAAIAAHASQVSDSSFFVEMPMEVFTLAFGTEWFIRLGAPVGIHEDWLAGL